MVHILNSVPLVAALLFVYHSGQCYEITPVSPCLFIIIILFWQAPAKGVHNKRWTTHTCWIFMGLSFILGLITIIMGSTALSINIYQHRMRLEDVMYEELMNSLTNNNSFDPMRVFVGQERQETYTTMSYYVTVIVLLVLLLFSLLAALMKNTIEFKADLYKALEAARNSSIQKMLEMSSIVYDRHRQDDNGEPLPTRVQ